MTVVGWAHPMTSKKRASKVLHFIEHGHALCNESYRPSPYAQLLPDETLRRMRQAWTQQTPPRACRTCDKKLQARHER
jgi:hypothetical protein